VKCLTYFLEEGTHSRKRLGRDCAKRNQAVDKGDRVRSRKAFREVESTGKGTGDAEDGAFLQRRSGGEPDQGEEKVRFLKQKGEN